MAVCQVTWLLTLPLGLGLHAGRDKVKYWLLDKSSIEMSPYSDSRHTFSSSMYKGFSRHVHYNSLGLSL